MRSLLSTLTVTTLLLFSSSPASSQNPFPIPSTASLPEDTGRDDVLRGCNMCHPVMLVLAQQRNESEWLGVVDAMRGRGAKVTDEEATRIAKYLAKYFAPGMPLRPGVGRHPAGVMTWTLGGRPPEVEPEEGKPLETRDPVGANQKPAFEGQTRAPAVRTRTPIDVKVVASGLEHPWGLAFLPKGRMLITEKPGAMRVISPTGEVGPKIANVPAVFYRSDAGLLDVIADPHFKRNRRIYFAYAEPREGGSGLAIARARLGNDESALEELKILLRIEPTHRSVSHFGCRLLFDKKGYLFVTSGERMDADIRVQAQDLDSRLGKLLRIDTDGNPAPGNPFANREGALADIWTYGHRNSQGLSYHPVTGALWSIEHGEAGGDELNLIEPGRNYGWPVIAYGMEYDRRPIFNGLTAAPGMEQPRYYWDPAIGPTGMTFYDGKLVPEWRNNLFVAGHISQHLVRLVLDGDRVVGEERLLLDQKQMMRWVGQGPDGALWVLTDDKDGRLIRLSAKKN